jgi:hypothetical protein
MTPDVEIWYLEPPNQVSRKGTIVEPKEPRVALGSHPRQHLQKRWILSSTNTINYPPYRLICLFSISLRHESTNHKASKLRAQRLAKTLRLQHMLSPSLLSQAHNSPKATWTLMRSAKHHRHRHQRSKAGVSSPHLWFNHDAVIARCQKLRRRTSTADGELIRGTFEEWWARLLSHRLDLHFGLRRKVSLISLILVVALSN